MRSSPVSPIFAASAWGFSEILEIEVGFEPFILDRQNKVGFTALMISSRYDQQDIVRLLLQNNVNLEIRRGYTVGDTALQIASRSGYTTVVRMLLDHGAIIDTQMFDKSTPLLEASSYGHKDIVQILLEKGADVNLQYGPKGESPRTALAAACAQGNADIVRLLINSGADVNSFDSKYGTALIGAAKYGRCITIQLLCEAGANVNLNIPSLKPGDYSSNKYPSALIAAAAQGHIDSVQLLLKSGADVNSWSGTWNYSTALISAADLHNVDWKYTSALIAAIRNGHTELVSLVLEAGADVNRKSTRFGSALEAAVETDHKAAVPLLLKKGAKMDNLDLNDREKITAVMELGIIELVRAITDSGVDVHAKDSHGWTPYDVAWAHGYKSICDLLPIEPSLNAYQDQVHGLRPDGLSKKGKTSRAWIPQDDLTVARGCMPFQQESMPI
jgi:ankyrin repeat protein